MFAVWVPLAAKRRRLGCCYLPLLQETALLELRLARTNNQLLGF
jgi:hypothetical protein